MFPCSLWANPIQSHGVGATRDAAIQDALRNAVQQGVGMELGSATLTNNFMIVRDQILTKTSGYVSKFKVTKEQQVLGSWDVSVDAEVAQGALRNDLAAKQLLYAAKSKPRILVLLDERAEDKPSFEKTATFKIEETLIAQGFKVVEAEQLEEIRKAEAGQDRTPQELARIGFRFGADLILRGNVSAGKATERAVYGVQMFMVPVQFNARVVRTDNAEIVSSTTNRVQKGSRDAFSATQFGLEQGGAEIAKTLAQKLLDAWQNEVYNGVDVTLEVKKSTADNRKALEDALLKSGIVREQNLRYLDGADAVYDLEILGSIQQLRDLVESSSVGFSLQAMSANRMRISSEKNTGAVQFELAAPELEIRAFHVAEIFPSRARSYSKDAVADVVIACSGQAVQQLKVGVLVPGVMKLAAEEVVAGLAAGESKTLHLKLIFDVDKLYEVSQTEDVLGQVKVSYRVKGVTQERTLTAPVRIYGRNTMDWAQTATIAAFVAYDHPVVMDWARRATQNLGAGEELQDLQQAAAIFEAMSTSGIHYVKDPSGSPGNRSLDRVQYPWQTVAAQSGDCDDLTVLFASLMASLGSEVAIISYPDHVLPMVNTGLAPKNWMMLGADRNMAVEYAGHLWIPVETTQMGKGFLEAWQTAAQEYQQALAQNQPMEVVLLTEAWKSWAPAALILKDKPTWNFDAKKISSAMVKFQTGEKQILQDQLAALKAKNSSDPSVRNHMGILAAFQNQFVEASQYFAGATGANAWKMENNRALALLLAGQETEAKTLLQSIADKAPEVQVNLAICDYLSAKDSVGIAAFVKDLQNARSRLGNADTLSQILGMELVEGQGTRGASGHEKAVPQSINRRELRDLIRSRVLAADTVAAKGAGKGSANATRNTVPFGGVRGADPSQLTRAAALLYWYDL